MLSDNNYNKEEKTLGGCCFSSCYPSVFESSFLISVKNVDLQTGLSILESISKEFSIQNIYFIKRGLRGGSGT